MPQPDENPTKSLNPRPKSLNSTNSILGALEPFGVKLAKQLSQTPNPLNPITPNPKPDGPMLQVIPQTRNLLKVM